MASSVYDRLQALRQRKKGGTGTGGATGGSNRRHTRRSLSANEGWEAIGHNLFRKETLHQLESISWLYGRSARASDALLLPPNIRPERIAFYDLETTGLSGGAGTMCFLFGIGWLRPGGLLLEQYFAADYEAEPDFLRAIHARLQESDAAVSYNGKSYDSHILRNRSVLNRITPVEAVQIDLLYPTRRLYGMHVDRCGLTEVSERVLGITREEDVPGYAIPDRYFAYLDDNSDERLRPVFAHHREDILSLARLLAAIEWEAESAARAGSAGAAGDADRAADAASVGAGVTANGFELARLLIERGRTTAHTEAGEASLAAIAADPGKPAYRRAAEYLAHRFRRAARYAEAAQVWESLYDSNRSVAAAIELSKLYEHRTRELEKAREVLQAALSWPHARAQRDAIRHRLKRIAGKIERLAREGTRGSSYGLP